MGEAGCSWQGVEATAKANVIPDAAKLANCLTAIERTLYLKVAFLRPSLCSR